MFRVGGKRFYVFVVWYDSYCFLMFSVRPFLCTVLCRKATSNDYSTKNENSSHGHHRP